MTKSLPLISISVSWILGYAHPIFIFNSRRLLNASRKDNRKLNKNNEQLRQENIRLKTQEASTRARTQRSGGKLQKSEKEAQGDDENEK